MAVKTIWLELGCAKVDREKGILHDVAVITQGEAKGHGLMVDEMTLSQVHAQMTGRGLKTKLNHGKDVRSVIGTMKNPKNAGQKVTADLHLFKSSPSRDYVFELAEEAPDSVGMSIEFEGKDQEMPDGTYAARCEKLNAVALVDRPAANAGGMFCEVSQSVDSKENTNINPIIPMTDQEQKDFKAAQDSIKALETKNAELATALAAAPKKEEVAALAMAEVTKQLAAISQAPVAAPAAAPVVAAPPPAPAKTFMDHVADFVAAGMKPTAALAAASQKFPELHKEYREKTLGVRLL